MDHGVGSGALPEILRQLAAVVNDRSIECTVLESMPQTILDTGEYAASDMSFASTYTPIRSTLLSATKVD